MIDAADVPPTRCRKLVGQLLRKIIINHHVNQSALARYLGYTGENDRQIVTQWMCGARSIEVAKLEPIFVFTGATSEEAEDLRAARLPALYLNGWLEQLLPEKRAGALLHDFRERAGYLQRTLGEKINCGHNAKVCERSISLMECGERPICLETYPNLIAVLNLTPEEVQFFQEQITVSDPVINEHTREKKLHRKELRKTSTALGGVQIITPACEPLYPTAHAQVPDDTRIR